MNWFLLLAHVLVGYWCTPATIAFTTSSRTTGGFVLPPPGRSDYSNSNSGRPNYHPHHPHQYYTTAFTTGKPFIIGTTRNVRSIDVNRPVVLHSSSSNSALSEKTTTAITTEESSVEQQQQQQQQQQQRINNVFHDATKEIIQSNNNNNNNNTSSSLSPKQINLNLITRGRQYDSYLHRFDYPSPSQPPPQEGVKEQRWWHEAPQWIRDNDQNENVVDFLVAHGLSREMAERECHREHVQSFRRRSIGGSASTSTLSTASSSSSSSSSSSTGQKRTSKTITTTTKKNEYVPTGLVNGLDFTFDIQTIRGSSLTTLLTTTPTISTSTSTTTTNTTIDMQWEGDTFVTRTFVGRQEKIASTTTTSTAADNSRVVESSTGTSSSSDENDDGKLLQIVKRHLEFSPINDSSSDRSGDNLVMIVTTTSFPTSSNEPIRCRQVYVRSYQSKNHDDTDDDNDDNNNTNKEENNDSQPPPVVAIGSPLQRVPGCTANVNIRTILVPQPPPSSSSDNTNTIPPQYRIIIDGDADALLSRGLLAILSDALSDPRLSIHDVLAIDPAGVAKGMRLSNLLSTGRNNGLGSIVVVVQKQIRNLLMMVEQQQGYGVVVGVGDGRRGQSISEVEGDTDDIIQTMTTPKYTTTSLPITQPSTTLLPIPTTGKKPPTVAMLLSGGVDSSVALNLLLQQGYDVTAFYLKIWLEDEFAYLGKDACPWEDDYNACLAVCEHASAGAVPDTAVSEGEGGFVVPLETLSLQREYKEKVIFYTIEEARKGRTPNPDIMCNSRVKFGCFYDAIEDRGFDYVASGHYAQLVVEDAIPTQTSNNSNNNNSNNNNKENNKTKSPSLPSTTKRVKLLRAPDPIKDQSYFLAALTQTQLQKVLFPIGHLHKHEVRTLATNLNLPNRNRPDSQGLCFLGKVKFDQFLAAYLGTDGGDIVDAETGEVIGHHRGLWFHTVGQRKGIGTSLDPQVTSRGPWYVVAKDPVRKLVIVSNRYDEEAFVGTRSNFYVEDITWISGDAPAVSGEKEDSGRGDGRIRMTMKIRHGPTLILGYLQLLQVDNDDERDGVLGDAGKIELDTKDGGLAPGQFVAFYDGIECLGSGIISERHWDVFCSEDMRNRTY